MAVLKCKMCGGDIIVQEGKTYGVCDSCGSTVTLPRIDNEKMENLFNRANHFRMICEFDRAVSTYELILNEDYQNAEAHWGLLLSRYGIEYVEDPATHKRIPTCHRIQYNSILADSDYTAALENAPDDYSRYLYEEQGRELAELQRDLLTVSMQSSSYDIFICYKESTEGGSRTIDSKIAQDIYNELTQLDYHVFFSRISLEDKLGTKYEPYIFAALNSAKVMLVVGTKQEHLNSVWVKNEWSRYLALQKQDRNKVVIPCYRDMSPYDLPDELSIYQSLDMGKIGFMQDLLHGIEKICSRQSATTTASNQSLESPNTILQRAFLCLEDGDKKKADMLLEKVLNAQPENAEAYVGKLMIQFGAQRKEALASSKKEIWNSINFKRAIQYGDSAMKARLHGYEEAIKKQLLADLTTQKSAEVDRLKKKIVSDSERYDLEITKIERWIEASKRDIAIANKSLKQAKQKNNIDKETLQTYQDSGMTGLIIFIAIILFIGLFGFMQVISNTDSGETDQIAFAIAFVGWIATPIIGYNTAKWSKEHTEEKVRKQMHVVEISHEDVKKCEEALQEAKNNLDTQKRQLKDTENEKESMIQECNHKIELLENSRPDEKPYFM